MSVNIFKNGILSKIAGAVGDAVPLINNFLTNQEGKGAADANTVYVLNNKIDELNSSLKYWIENGYLPDPNLVALIPTMTSNTTPYGEASASSEDSSSHAAWKAFNGNYKSETNYWETASSTSNGWLQYKFVNPVRVRRLFLYLNCASWGTGQVSDLNFILQASNDGSNFIDLSEELTAVYDTTNKLINYSANIDNDNYYSYYRVYAKPHIGVVGQASTFIAIGGLQLYDN